MLYSPILCVVTCFQEINDRMEYLINKIVRQITAHAESLHEEVEVMAKVRNNKYQKSVSEALESKRRCLQN